MVTRAIALALSAWLLASPPARAQSRTPTSEEVEAAYLYQFGRYVEWPPDRSPARQTFLICILGMDPFGAALDDIVADKVIDGRPIAVRRISVPDDSAGCRILFVSPSEDSRVPAILDALDRAAIVTVGRGAQFTQRGGMIAFTAVERRVRFVVNLPATQAAGLRLSSQLLRVAVRVDQ